MACGDTARKRNPQEKQGNSRHWRVLHRAGVSSTGDPHASTAGWCPAVDSATRRRPRRHGPGTHHIGVHRHAQLPAEAQRLEPGGRGRDAVLGEVNGPAALDALDDLEPGRPAHLHRCARPSPPPRTARPAPPAGWCGSCERRRRRPARAGPVEGGGADDRDRAGVEVRTCRSRASTRTRVAEALATAPRRGPRRRPSTASSSRRDLGRVPSAAVAAAYGEDLVAAPEPAGVLAGRQPALAVDHGVGPVADQAACSSMSTRPGALPPIDFTG